MDLAVSAIIWRRAQSIRRAQSSGELGEVGCGGQMRLCEKKF